VSPTIRQVLASVLESRELSAAELARELVLTPGEVENHLGHLKRSHKDRLRLSPARCQDCGYVFRKRDRLDAPGRCPRCRGQRVEGPWFSLRPKKPA
jgi:predicted Zn-ribbon and HTH transcriptional regulator